MLATVSVPLKLHHGPKVTLLKRGIPLAQLGRDLCRYGQHHGLSRSRQLIMPDTRGTGEPADASDPLSYRCDWLVGDVEALRAHLGLDRMDLLDHSAAGSLATLCAAAYPERVAHLILLTPGLDAVGADDTEERWCAALYAGELDAAPTPEAAVAGARLFPNATVTVQPEAAHFPWLDDPAFFTAAVTSFLS